MKMLWSGRFRKPLDPGFEKWQRSFGFDHRLLAYEIAASGAHARALKSVGILASDELISILKGLEEIGKRGTEASTFLLDDEAEDVHHFVEKQLVAIIGDTGYKLHSGRSRNEQIATDLRLFIRASIDQLAVEISGWLAVLLERAERAGNSAMPAYTHLQRAEPVLVAHWLLAYVEMFSRDAGRLADCRKRLNECPLGSGAVAGATLTLDRRTLARDLEFDCPTRNSVDATSDRDFVLEFGNALSMIGIHMSRWAEEMILFSTQEFNFVHLPESYSTGSSAMPQKKNADLLELTRAKSARLMGNTTALSVALKGLPLAYNKDLQEMQVPLFEAADSVLSLFPLIIGFMNEVEFNSERMQQAAESSFMNAWAAATYLVQRGVPFRLAHEQIGKAVQMAIERHCELRDLALDDLRELNPQFAQDFYSCLTLQSVLEIHDVPGGTAPRRVKHAIADAKVRIASLREELHANA